MPPSRAPGGLSFRLGGRWRPLDLVDRLTLRCIELVPVVGGLPGLRELLAELRRGVGFRRLRLGLLPVQAAPEPGEPERAGEAGEQPSHETDPDATLPAAPGTRWRREAGWPAG